MALMWQMVFEESFFVDDGACNKILAEIPQR